MPTDLILQPAPATIALLETRERLASIRTTLAGREADLAQLRAQLKAFEVRYLRQVGILYAALDELEARIAEREVDLYDSDSARRRAREARQRAQETRDATSAELDPNAPEEQDPPPTLKTLFREVARRIHPDFAADEAEQAHFTLLMARANHAYSRGDIDALQRLLDDRLELSAALAGEPAATELLRLDRQIQHAQRDLAGLDAEEQTLLTSELGQLYSDAQRNEHLLTTLATGLRAQITDAQQRFELIDRQITAHGK